MEPAPFGLLETKAAIAVVTDSIVHSVSANFNGTAFWALTSGCCLEPLLASVCYFGQGILIVVEECRDDVHSRIFLLVWSGDGTRSVWVLVI